MNFKGYNKVKQDDERAVFKHKNGHEIHIAIHKLSPKHKAALNAIPMSEGGEVKSPAKKTADGSETQQPKDEDKKKSLGSTIGFPMSQGGQVPNLKEKYKKMADGGEALPVDANAATEDSAELPPVPQAFQPGAKLSDFLPYGTGDSALKADALESSGGASLADMKSPMMAPAQAPAAESQAQPQSSGVASGLESQIQGAKDYATAVGNLGNEQATIQNQQAKVEQEQLQRTQDIHNHIQNEMDSLSEDVKSHPIVAKGIFDNMGADQKISTAIGLMVGGFGAGVAGQENQALKYISDQMERDLKSQMANADRKNNLFSAYLKEYGNTTDAQNMTRMALSNVVLSKMQAAAAKAQSPIAQAQMEQQIGPLKQQMNMMQMAFAQSKAAEAGDSSNIESQINAMQFLNPERAKQMRESYVPGIGISRSLQPVPEAVRTKLIQQQNLLGTIQKTQHFLASHGGIEHLDPGARAQAEVLGTELQGMYRQAIQASTSQEEAKQIEHVIPSNPLAVLNSITAQPRLAQFLKTMTMQHNNERRAYGLPQVAEPQGAHPMEGKIAVNPKTGQQIVMQNGKWVSYGRQ